ncbi:hypothetical protein [Methanobrevibacter sp. UBA212]|nr:hypothetical protein [Methanobrevibacter sp. UBA212]
MNKSTKMTLIVLSVFIVGITMAVLVAVPIDTKTFKDKGYRWEIKEDE